MIAILLALVTVGCGEKKADVGGATPEEHAGEAAAKGNEHAGQEHAGAEHGGEAAQGHPASHIKEAMKAHIDAKLAEGGGVLKIADDKTGEALELEFVTIHDPVRKIEGKGYFACTDFHPKGTDATKLYDLDFWLDDALKVTDTKIHKHPEQKDGAWVKVERYTFVNDNPVEVK